MRTSPGSPAVLVLAAETIFRGVSSIAARTAALARTRHQARTMNLLAQRVLDDVDRAAGIE
jgi:hypothetical protein